MLMRAWYIPVLTALLLPGLDAAALGQDSSAKSPARTSAEKAQAALSTEEQEVIRRHFEVCDLNGNGWISFGEASATLGIPKSEFRRYDVNNDGRFSGPEFRQEKRRMLQLLGALQRPLTESQPAPSSPVASGLDASEWERSGDSARTGLTRPVPRSLDNPWNPSLGASSSSLGEEAFPFTLVPSDTREPLFPAPRDLIAFFDRDASGGLSREEVGSVLSRLHAGLSADVIVDRTDQNGTEELEWNELRPLAAMVQKRWAASGFLRPGDSEAAPRALQAESPSGEATQPTADQPSSHAEKQKLSRPTFDHFSYLDANADGRIDARDLRLRLAPARASIRTSSIISALDLNGDGALDEAEFHAALQSN